jgi:hypothetical protein
MGVLREAMQREMALLGLAPRTQKTYLSWMVRLVQHSRVSPDLISEYARFMVALPNNAADEAGASDGASQLNAVSGRPAALSSG